MLPSQVIQAAKETAKSKPFRDPSYYGWNLDAFAPTADNVVLVPIVSSWFSSSIVSANADQTNMNDALFLVVSHGPDARVVKQGQVVVPVKAALDTLTVTPDVVFMCSEKDIVMVSNGVNEAFFTPPEKG